MGMTDAVIAALRRLNGWVFSLCTNLVVQQRPLPRHIQTMHETCQEQCLLTQTQSLSD